MMFRRKKYIRKLWFLACFMVVAFDDGPSKVTEDSLDI